MKKERPIPFRDDMVRAILAGRKTQTRRVVKPQPTALVSGWSDGAEPGDVVILQPASWPHRLAESKGRNKRAAGDLTPTRIACPYGEPGDLLWVKETWCESFAWDDDSRNGYCYRATNDGPEPGRWKSSRYMPRSASRITLEVVAVRCERVQSITADDARAEGPPDVENNTWPTVADYHPVEAFASLWDEINAKRGHPWDANPWVWVVEFRVLEVTP